ARPPLPSGTPSIVPVPGDARIWLAATDSPTSGVFGGGQPTHHTLLHREAAHGAPLVVPGTGLAVTVPAGSPTPAAPSPTPEPALAGRFRRVPRVRAAPR